MKISVFTPSHNPKHLAECWRSLKNQDFTGAFEWVIVPNGERTHEVAAEVRRLKEDPDGPRGDVRICVFPDSGEPVSIGALKKFACSQATGDVLLELDHDDVLTTDCLSEVAWAVSDPARKLFVYSNDVTLNVRDENGARKTESVVYSPHYGWGDPVPFGPYRANRNFPVTPGSLAEIYYAPDHVRAWTRAAYDAAGGHDAAFPVCDDHDLMVRTYLAGAQFVGIEKPLYIHRLFGDNTSEARVSEIRRRTHAVRDANLHKLVAEWCRRSSLPMLDLGGYHNCPEGFLPVDSNPKVAGLRGGIHADVVAEAVRFNPKSATFFNGAVGRNSVGCIRAFDFLEHVPMPDVPHVMNMLYEMLVPGGYLLTHTPAVCDDDGRAGRGAYQDPTHVSFWSSNTFWYYTDREYAKYDERIACRFGVVRMANGYPSPFHRDHLIPYVTADLCALKPENDRVFPGVKKI